ncbi:anti sigma factor C-terminal domain-containing protein [Paenibacillus sp. FA6]|uniref:anti sigma factor C-terminal domain-containing protein n=1 Tax=Paenibacillus sp. FA6 TaxID=3413029 RepID=UPI003F65ED40
MEKDLNHFSFDEKQATKLMRKAKLWSTLKMIGITVIVTPIVFVLLWYGFRSWSLNQAQQTMKEIVMFNEISAPNVHISHQTYDNNWFGGTIKTKTFKWIGNVPYVWESVERKYTLFGRSSRIYGSFGAIPLDLPAESNQFNRYNADTGDREMIFYHPEISYDAYKDIISDLNQVDDTTLVELGLSFDKAYHFDEIKSLVPSDVQFVWWWVDAYTDDYLVYMKQGKQVIPADSMLIYGFHSEQFEITGGIDTFITNVEQLRESSKSFKWAADEIHKSLVGDNQSIEQSDVKIIGAVVTGTSKQLEVLQGQSFIKASTFGVISDKKSVPN